MGKRLINTSTQLDLNIPENKVKLSELKDGELVVQSSKAGELKIWGKTLGGSIVSTPSNGEIAELIDGKLSEIEVDSFIKKENLNTINGKSLYNESGVPVDIVIEGGNVDEEQLKEYAKKSDLNSKANVDDVYTKEDTNALLKNKIDSTAVYTKEQTNILLDSKLNVGSAYSKEEVNTELSKKADKIYTYSKEEINELVSTIPTFGIEVVNELPVDDDISETTLYLLVSGESEDGTLYAIYLFSNNEWKELGKQAINFNNYFTKDEVSNVISEAIRENAKNYYTQEEINSKLSDVIRVGNAVTSADFDAYKETIYTKDEVDEIINGIEVSGGTITEEQLENLVQKDGLKTINGQSLLLTGEEGEITDIVITGGNIDVEVLKGTFVEKTIYDEKIETVEASINQKVDESIFTAKTKTIDATLENKADKTFVTEYVQASLATTESYGMIVIPETVYEELVKNGQTYWNDVLLTYNENNIYFLYDETEEPEIPEEPVEPEQPTPDEPEIPGDNEEPTEPENPENGEDPTEPENPENGEDPTEPSEPEQGGDPIPEEPSNDEEAPKYDEMAPEEVIEPKEEV